MSLLRWSAAGLIAVFELVSAPEASAKDELCKGKRDCRPLTSDEIKYAKKFFGDRIDYGVVRIVNRPSELMALYADATAHKSRIHYHALDLLSPDHSEASIDNRIILIHELAHVWQYQNGINVRAQGLGLFFQYPMNYRAAYKYKLDRAFNEYNMEQQAKIVEDYALDRDIYTYLKSKIPGAKGETRQKMKAKLELLCDGIAARYEVLRPYLPLSAHKCNHSQ